MLPSVVSVTAFSGNTGSAGSGVVMSADGYIITNYHVIEGMAEAWVGLLTEEATQSKESTSIPPSWWATMRIWTLRC